VVQLVLVDLGLLGVLLNHLDQQVLGGRQSLRGEVVVVVGVVVEEVGVEGHSTLEHIQVHKRQGIHHRML